MFRTVLFKCGHEYTIWLDGTRLQVLEQEKAILKYCDCHQCTIDYAGVCGPCTDDELIHETQREGFPPLAGSASQVKQAMYLRHQMNILHEDIMYDLCQLEGEVLRTFPKYKPLIHKRFIKHDWDGKDPFWIIYRTWVDMLKEKADAEWWIAHRHNFGCGLANAVLHKLFDPIIIKPKLQPWEM